MPEIAVKITNLADIKRAFALAPILMARELNISIRRVVLQIGRESRMATPVDTGRLRASTYERFSHLKGEVGTNTDYDIFVHEGTRFMRGRPYLRNSVQNNEQTTDREFTSAVQRVLEEIGRKT